MLDRTFCHLPGVGAKRERRRWDSGYYRWRDLLRGMERGSPPVPSPGRIKAGLEKSLERLQHGDAAYFAELLPQTEMWRLFPAFRENTAYVDIETTGLGRSEEHITSIALWDGIRVATYVHGRNLRRVMRDLARMVQQNLKRARWLLRLQTADDRWRWFRVAVFNQLQTEEQIRLKLYPVGKHPESA